MRITTGRFAGRRIRLPKGPEIRPTLDYVKQALFNLIGEKVREASVLDLFCGTGALGLEALSRGAAHVTFVDRSSFCVHAVEASLEELRCAAADPASCAIVRREAFTALRHLDREGASFDLILLDPPYGRELARKSLNAISQYAIVADAGWVAVEHEKRDLLPPECDGQTRLVRQRSERYGDTLLTFYVKQ